MVILNSLFFLLEFYGALKSRKQRESFVFNLGNPLVTWWLYRHGNKISGTVRKKKQKKAILFVRSFPGRANLTICGAGSRAMKPIVKEEG